MNLYELTQSAKDLEEHLKITKQNLQIANVGLTNIFLEKKSLNDEIKVISDRVILSKKELNDVNLELEKNTKLANNILKEAQVNFDLSNKVLSESKIKAIETINDSVNQKEKLDSSILKLKEDNSILTKNNSELNNETLRLQSEIKKSFDSLELSKKELNLIDNEIGLKKKELEDITNLFTRENNRINKQLEESSNLLKIEIEKVNNPLESLKEKELEVKRKEKNLEVLKFRFEKRFKKIFPNQQVII